MSRAVVYCERDEVALELVGAARSLGCAPVAICVLAGHDDTGSLTRSATATDEVHRFRLPEGETPTAETAAGALAEMASAGEAAIILLGSTRRGKEMAGRLAQRLGAGCITDALTLRLEDSSLVADRYALGGSTVASERILTEAKVVAVMPGAFPGEPREGGQPAVVEHGTLRQQARVRVVERRVKAVEGASIESATVLVGAGKGFRKREDLSLALELARRLHGEVGCTRAIASELAWLSEERLIGLSGKRCRPRLYLALGVSGQVQHTVGIAGARIIVAVNLDKEAPIFRMSDYGIVGDLYRIVPELVRQLG
jgi:electron transfer flavoprotein alpha subunit